jgi:D-alanine-D-alanine ligase
MGVHQAMALRIGFAYNEKPAEEEEPPSSASHDRFAEWDDPTTIAAVAHALSLAGMVIPLEADEEFPARLRETRPDIVFNIAEGLNGPNREAHVPAICEFYGIPYTGSDPLTLALGLDKERTKEVLAARGIRTPRWTVAGGASGSLNGRRLRFPVIVKPLFEGSSKGIDSGSLRWDRKSTLERVRWVVEGYGQPALVEEFLPGREFTVAVLGNGDEARILPPVEIRFDSLPEGAPALYGWEAKWVWDTPEAPLSIFECPAQVDPDLLAALEKATLGAYHALGCRDWARIDLRLDATGEPHVLELNALPGILPDPRQNSCFPKAARAAGLGYEEMILAVLDTGLRRLGMGGVGAAGGAGETAAAAGGMSAAPGAERTAPGPGPGAPTEAGSVAE